MVLTDRSQYTLLCCTHAHIPVFLSFFLLIAPLHPCCLRSIASRCLCHLIVRKLCSLSSLVLFLLLSAESAAETWSFCTALSAQNLPMTSTPGITRSSWSRLGEQLSHTKLPTLTNNCVHNDDLTCSFTVVSATVKPHIRQWRLHYCGNTTEATRLLQTIYQIKPQVKSFTSPSCRHDSSFKEG